MAGIISAGDLYGNQAGRFVGVKQQTSAIAASGSVGVMEKANPNTNASFSWLAFVGVLVLIRVLEMSAKSI